MTKVNLLFTALSAQLAVGAFTPQEDALHTWLAEYWPKAQSAASTLFAEGFDFQSLGALASVAVSAAQSLKGLFAGAERAQIAQIIFVEAAKAAIPDDYEHWIIPMLQSAAAGAMIEAAFRRLFGAGVPVSPPEQGADAVVDAPELPEAEIEGGAE